MDKNRVAGSIKEIKGAAKEAVGKAIGDAKLQSDGKTDKAVGKISERRRQPKRCRKRGGEEIIDASGTAGAIKSYQEAMS